jgi:hypothetical protein
LGNALPYLDSALKDNKYIDNHSAKTRYLHNGCTIKLHTHAFAEDVIYHLDWEVFATKGSHDLHFTDDAAKHWNSHKTCQPKDFG